MRVVNLFSVMGLLLKSNDKFVVVVVCKAVRDVVLVVLIASIDDVLALSMADKALVLFVFKLAKCAVAASSNSAATSLSSRSAMVPSSKSL